MGTSQRTLYGSSWHLISKRVVWYYRKAQRRMNLWH